MGMAYIGNRNRIPPYKNLINGELTFQQKTLSLFSGNFIGYWPLNEIEGTVAYDISGNNRNGNYINMTLANILAPTKIGGYAPYFNGSNGYINLFSPDLASAFNGAAGSLLLFVKVNAVSFWTDGLEHELFRVYAAGTNQIILRKRTNDGQLEWVHYNGGIAEQVIKASVSETDWFNITWTWDASIDEAKAYYNGVQEGATQTGLGAWAGVPGVILLGAANVTPTLPHVGWQSHAIMLNRAATPTEVADIASFFNIGHEIMTYGDSKTALNDYQPYLQTNIEVALGINYASIKTIAKGGRTAALGASVIDSELSLSNANPSEILCNLGANDVVSLPAEATWKTNYQYILSALNNKWPTAKIYIMRPWRRTYNAECNTLAGWIADLVAANSWAYSGPDERVFLENGDDGVTYTTDGLHPNDAGYALTAAQWQAVIGY